MVFVPSPLLTITVEQHGDDPDIHLHAGGQGVWQARMITTLGVPVVVCAALGGETGGVLEPLIVAEGVQLQVVHAESRTAAYIHDRRNGEREPVVESHGDPLARHDLDELYGLALAEGLRASVSLLSGPSDPSVVDPEVYRRLAHDLSRNGCVVLADLSGEHLTATLSGGLYLVKVSHEELINDGRAADDSEAALVRAMQGLLAEGARAVVVSRAEQPALALIDQQVYQVVLPELEPADPRGAGDSMTAGVAAVLAAGGDLQTAVRTGAAAGAVNVTRHGLGTGRASVIAQLMERVKLTPLRTAATGTTSAGTRAASPQELADQVRQAE